MDVLELLFNCCLVLCLVVLVLVGEVLDYIIYVGMCVFDYGIL